MRVDLVMFRQDGEKRSFNLTKDTTVIGRREDCDMRIPLSEVSRKHCRLIKDNGALRVEDLGSSNGTYVNGQRVQETSVEPGDSVQIGSVVFVVQIDGHPHEDEMQPVIAVGEDAGSAIAHESVVPLADDSHTRISGDENHPAGDRPFDPMEALDPNQQSGMEFDIDEIADELEDENTEAEHGAQHRQEL
jgi:pSer/pThr/pTyr-binding forkhead associated (FHA) protein